MRNCIVTSIQFRRYKSEDKRYIPKELAHTELISSLSCPLSIAIEPRPYLNQIFDKPMMHTQPTWPHTSNDKVVQDPLAEA